MRKQIRSIALSFACAVTLLGAATGSHAYIIAGKERAELIRHAMEPFQNTVTENAPNPMHFKLNYGNMGTHKITWGLRGENAPTIVHTKHPSFLIGFNGIPNLDPGDYIPVLVRLNPYVDAPSGQHGRTGGTTTLTYTSTGPKMQFADDKVDANVRMPAPGEASVEPDGPLDPGHYAIVLRPLNVDKLTAGSRGYEAMTAGSAGGSVQPWQYAWDFTVVY